jgi:hypothetical protein
VPYPIPAVLLILLCVACGKSDDTARPTYGEASDNNLLSMDPDTGYDDGTGVLADCDVILTKVNGRDAETVDDPKVGDEWIIRMFCDGALLTGANRLFFQPPNVAVVNQSSTDATFVTTGESKMTIQSGNLIYTKDITVQAAE